MAVQVATRIRETGTACITLTGRLEVGDTAMFHRACEKAIERTPASEILEVDMAQLDYIDSAGIGALMVLNNRFCDIGRRVTYVNCQSSVLRLMRMLNLHRVLNFT